ncbi:SGNH/GDSL hydrolase family protein [Paenibacillus sp. PR3]|uniref:SGNH/GDSL hydrolase family protein n=1 Tax=Paenibacillus terricola TaxID=2763503 RepID=A0ABR8MNM0_9BACL|nr:SGNH/GDSL hydrolase family protein [Paenibacillus terricola]MBD3917608.1 SGNH/GDSL hydrolase family protein [Paenibacillus terricola]
MKRMFMLTMIAALILTACGRTSSDVKSNHEGAASTANKEGESNKVDIDASKPFVPENPENMPSDDISNSGVGEKSGNKLEDYAKEEWYQTLLANAQMNVGNNYRLKAIVDKAKAGEEVTIASIGGSITEGAGAKNYSESYAYRTYEYFKNEYGVKDGSNIHFINAGVGGTPSTFGIMRYQRDIVSRVADPDGLPDIVMVEFAVNDYGEPTNHQAYESLVKNILLQPNAPVVILVFSVFPTGFTMQDELKKVGQTYDLMMVSTKDSAFPHIGKEWTEDQFFYDIYHPTSLGHGVMADAIFHTIKAAAEKETSASDIDLEVPPAYGTQYVGLKSIFKDSYDKSIQLSLGSFSEDDPNVYRNFPIGKLYEHNFHHVSGTKSLKFTIDSKNLLLAYRAVNDADFGEIDIYVDGEKTKTINGNTGSWGQSVVDLIFSEDVAEQHTIEIKMAEGSEDKKFTITCMGYTE